MLVFCSSGFSSQCAIRSCTAQTAMTNQIKIYDKAPFCTPHSYVEKMTLLGKCNASKVRVVIVVVVLVLVLVQVLRLGLLPPPSLLLPVISDMISRVRKVSEQRKEKELKAIPSHWVKCADHGRRRFCGKISLFRLRTSDLRSSFNKPVHI